MRLRDKKQVEVPAVETSNRFNQGPQEKGRKVLTKEVIAAAAVKEET